MKDISLKSFISYFLAQIKSNVEIILPYKSKLKELTRGNENEKFKNEIEV